MSTNKFSLLGGTLLGVFIFGSGVTALGLVRSISRRRLDGMASHDAYEDIDREWAERQAKEQQKPT